MSSLRKSIKSPSTGECCFSSYKRRKINATSSTTTMRKLMESHITDFSKFPECARIKALGNLTTPQSIGMSPPSQATKDFHLGHVNQIFTKAHDLWPSIATASWLIAWWKYVAIYFNYTYHSTFLLVFQDEVMARKWHIWPKFADLWLWKFTFLVCNYGGKI